MWTRGELKERAKVILRNSYWRALIVSFIIVIAGGSLISNASNSGSSNTNRKSAYAINSHVSNIQKRIQSNYWMSDGNIEIPFKSEFIVIPRMGSRSIHSFFDGVPGILSFPMFILAGILSLVIGMFMIFFRILIGYNLEVGGRRYFLLAALGDERLSNAFNNIKSRYYVNIIITMFLRSLYTFLWSLLFIIPGIVKFYAYRMVPYILAENPDMTPSEAITLSCRMTEGHKMSMFILDISFIGWYILGALAFGIGKYFVNPYVESTFAQLYLTLSSHGGTYKTDDYIDARYSN